LRAQRCFVRIRGDRWMKQPCGSCPRKSIDFAGCRCQAFALTGDASNPDPVCTLTPYRHIIDDAAADTASGVGYQYRSLRLEPV
jgi:PqqA peptide cyclase